MDRVVGKTITELESERRYQFELCTKDECKDQVCENCKSLKIINFKEEL